MKIKPKTVDGLTGNSLDTENKQETISKPRKAKKVAFSLYLPVFLLEKLDDHIESLNAKQPITTVTRSNFIVELIAEALR